MSARYRFDPAGLVRMGALGVGCWYFGWSASADDHVVEDELLAAKHGSQYRGNK